MRLFRFSCVIATLLSLLGGEAFSQGPSVCPQWPIGEWEGKLVYFAMYQQECGGAEEEVYLYGDFDWPTSCGAGGCIPADQAFLVGSSAKPNEPRGGILARGWGPKTDDFEMPLGPARRFSSRISQVAVRFDHDGSAATPEKTAFCYTYLVNAAALGGDSASKVMQFGFEAINAPAPGEAKPAKVVRNRNSYTYHVECEGNTYVVQLR